MFCYVDRYFVILFCLLHFLFQRVLVSVSLVSEYDLVLHTDYIYNLITDYIICVYAVHMRYMCVCINTHICIYICVCAVIPHTALLSHSKLPQGKFLHRESPNCITNSLIMVIIFKSVIKIYLLHCY